MRVSQYADDHNLSRRAAIYQYATDTTPWATWYFSAIPRRPSGRVLDVGCGNATLWKGSSGFVDRRLRVDLVDLSPGMIDAARRNLEGVVDGPTWHFHVARIEDLPFPASHFDLVMANHMLYHVDIEPALNEVARVLKPGGMLLASTNGAGHLRRLGDLLIQVGLTEPAGKLRVLQDAFGLETGAKILGRFFRRVVARRRHDTLAVPDPQPILDYVGSLDLPDTEQTRVSLLELRRVLEREIRANGAIRIETDSGILQATASTRATT